MKKLSVTFLFLVILTIHSLAQTYKLGVISDIHYLSEKLMDKGEAIQIYVNASGRNVMDVPLVLDSVITEYLNEKIDLLFIPGDLTKDGEKQSHIDVRNKLNRLRHEGIKIFVIPGNHDVNIPTSVRYEGANTYRTDNISADDFKTIYADFGYASAIKQDTSSLSYVAEISDRIWLLAIDACRYSEHTTHSISSGRVTALTEEWVLQVLKEAAEKNIRVIGMMHHGLLEHIVYQDMLFPQYLVDDWQRLSRLLSDNGLKAMFTGHSHANDISELTSSDGKKLYDIETGALCSYPFSYRLATLSYDALNITTRNISDLPQNPNLLVESKALLSELVAKMTMQKMKGRLPNDMSSDMLSQIAQIVGEIFLLHVAGDEVVDDSLKKRIENIARKMDIPIDLSPEYFQLDFPPSDNTLNIRF